MGRKFHHNYSQSEATNQRVQGRMQYDAIQTSRQSWLARAEQAY